MGEMKNNVQDWVKVKISFKNGNEEVLYQRNIEFNVLELLETGIEHGVISFVLKGLTKLDEPKGMVINKTLIVTASEISSVSITDEPQLIYDISLPANLEDFTEDSGSKRTFKGAKDEIDNGFKPLKRGFDRKE